MNREEFLQGLKAALSGNIPQAAVRENLQYYNDYIRSECAKGREEGEVMDELGDPRLIAKTIIDTTPGAGEGAFAEYREVTPGSGAGDGAGNGSGQRTGGQSYEKRSSVHYYDLSKWYWKVLAIVMVILVVTLVITIVTGLLSLVIPLLPVIGLVMLIMWFVRGSGH